MSYTTFKADIATYLHRTDLTAVIPTFIARAESYLFRELQAKQLQLSDVGTTTGQYITLPADFGSVSRITITHGGVERALDYQALPLASTTSSAFPRFYSLEENKLRIWGAGNAQAYTLLYVPAFGPLSDSNTTNWLLDNAGDLYLYAACLEGARHVRNEAEIQRLTPFLPALLESVKRFTERRGQPSTGAMQIKPRVAV